MQQKMHNFLTLTHYELLLCRKINLNSSNSNSALLKFLPAKMNRTNRLQIFIIKKNLQHQNSKKWLQTATKIITSQMSNKSQIIHAHALF